jgi:hypothetical protein
MVQSVSLGFSLCHQIAQDTSISVGASSISRPPKELHAFFILFEGEQFCRAFATARYPSWMNSKSSTLQAMDYDVINQ